jgi:probable phosphoglycerate mutase
MIAARWLGLPPGAGRLFFCRPASVGVLAFEHDSLDEPIVCLWNYVAPPRDSREVSVSKDEHT